MRTVFRCLVHVAVIALVAFGSLNAADATTVRELPIQEHLAESQLVIHAVVTKQNTFRAEDGIVYTDTTFEVRDVLEGELADKSITVRQWGGTLDEMTHSFPGDAHFVRDQEVVLFLADREPEKKVLFLTALVQSVYEVAGTTAQGDLLLSRSFDGLTFYDPNLPEPLFVKDAEVVTLSQLKQAIARAEEGK